MEQLMEKTIRLYSPAAQRHVVVHHPFPSESERFDGKQISGIPALTAMKEFGGLIVPPLIQRKIISSYAPADKWIASVMQGSFTGATAAVASIPFDETKNLGNAVGLHYNFNEILDNEKLDAIRKTGDIHYIEGRQHGNAMCIYFSLQTLRDREVDVKEPGVILFPKPIDIAAYENVPYYNS